MKLQYWFLALVLITSLLTACAVAQEPLAESAEPTDEELSASEHLLKQAIESAYGPTVPNVLYEPPEPATTEVPEETADETATISVSEGSDDTGPSDAELSASEDMLKNAIESAYGPTVPNVLYEPPEPAAAEAPREAVEESATISVSEGSDTSGPSDAELSASEDMLKNAIESAYGPTVPNVLYEPPAADAPSEPVETPVETQPVEPSIPRQPLPAKLDVESDIYDRPRELRMLPSAKARITKRELPAMVCPPPVFAGIGAINVEGFRPRGYPFLYSSFRQAVAAHDLYSAMDFINGGEPIDGDPTESERTPLLDAVEAGDAHMTHLLWTRGADRNAKDKFGNMAMHLAAAADRVYMIRMLHRRGQSVMVRNAANYTPLHVAAERGKLGAIKTLVALGADMSALCEENVYSPPLLIAGRAKQWKATALLRELGPDYAIHQAVAVGDLGAVRDMLRTRPARVNEENHLGQTPLFSAVLAQQRDMVILLLQHHADVHAVSKTGNSPFNLALRLSTFEIAELLLQAGARVDGMGALQIRDPLLHRAARAGNVRVIDFLLDHGADIELTDHKGETALFAAVYEGQNRAIERLATRGAKIQHEGEDGQTALHEAARLGLTGTIECLLACGADINARTHLRFTPLHVATHADQPRAVKCLLDHGATVSRRDLYGRSCLHIAALLGRMDTARLLFEAGGEVRGRDRARNTPLHLAAENGHWRLADWLLDNGAMIDAINRQGSTALGVALIHDHFALARRLAMRGADLNTSDGDGKGLAHVAASLERSLPLEWVIFMGVAPDTPDRDGRTPLHVAAERGGREVLQLLIEQGVPIDPTDVDGRSPLHMAALRGESDLIADLLRAGAAPDLADGDGRMPIHLCALAGNLEAATPFFDRGQDLNAPDQGGNTVVHCAVAGGNIEFLRTVLHQGGEFAVRNKLGQTPIDLTETALLDPVELAALSNEQRRERHWRFSRMRFLLRAVVYEQYRESAMWGDTGRLATLFEYYPEYIDHTSFSRTPLHCAAKYGRLDAARFLLRHGADINRCADTMDGFTPLQEAIDSGNAAMVRFLADQGASIKQRSALGKTAQMVAIQAGRKQIVDLVDSLESAPDTEVSKAE